MENRRIKALLMLLLTGMSSSVFAAGSNFLDDTFYRDGKYYVAVAVLVIIFLALFIYLFTLDRKISGIEKELNDEN